MALILYDGDCGLCARVVQFTLARDRHDRFRFAALQSDYARPILERHHKSTSSFDTFFVVHDLGTPGERLHERSDAGLDVISGLGGAWSLTAILRWVPRFIRNAVYDFIARRRLFFFGRADQCLIPTKESRAKFLA
jgi:predicted DCC family thiol-disulfide oxidoreductase YuxK